MIHESAWAVVDSLTGDRHVVGVHDAMDEAHMHPAGNERRLFVAHALEESEVRVRMLLQAPGSGDRSHNRPGDLPSACSPRAAKNWKVPTRTWLAATRVKTAPGSARSR